MVGEKRKNERERNELYQREETEVAGSVFSNKGTLLYLNNEPKSGRKQLSSLSCWFRRSVHCISSLKNMVVHGRLCCVLEWTHGNCMAVTEFIHGDGDANWLLHLETFSAVLPYNKELDPLNYFRWGNSLLNGYEGAARGRPNSTSRLHWEESARCFNVVVRAIVQLLHQTWHWSRQWTEIPKPKEELLEWLAWRAQEIGGHSQFIWWRLQQRLSKLWVGLQQAQASIENWGHKELKEMKMTWIISFSVLKQNR